MNNVKNSSAQIAEGIKTAGELRQFLSEVLVAVRGGIIDPVTAKQIVGVASQINESFYSEIKVSRVQKDLGQSSVPFGELPINKASP